VYENDEKGRPFFEKNFGAKTAHSARQLIAGGAVATDFKLAPPIPDRR
jgi:hypothetical protein